jgi:hypothetical protein
MRSVQASNPCFSIERVVTYPVLTRGYGVVAMGGCHQIQQPVEWGLDEREVRGLLAKAGFEPF